MQTENGTESHEIIRRLCGFHHDVAFSPHHSPQKNTASVDAVFREIPAATSIRYWLQDRQSLTIVRRDRYRIRAATH